MALDQLKTQCSPEPRLLISIQQSLSTIHPTLVRLGWTESFLTGLGLVMIGSRPLTPPPQVVTFPAYHTVGMYYNPVRALPPASQRLGWAGPAPPKRSPTWRFTGKGGECTVHTQAGSVPARSHHSVQMPFQQDADVFAHGAAVGAGQVGQIVIERFGLILRLGLQLIIYRPCLFEHDPFVEFGQCFGAAGLAHPLAGGGILA